MEVYEKHFGEVQFRSFFLQWINLLYLEQRDVISMEGAISREISICRGVRQGYPLSLPLFNLVTEAWAIAVRSCSEIFGIIVGQSVHKLVLYADAVVVVVVFNKTPCGLCRHCKLF